MTGDFTIDDIMSAVCIEYNIPMDKLTTPAKRKSPRIESYARQTVTYLCIVHQVGNYQLINQKLGYVGTNQCCMINYNFKTAQRVLSVDKAYKEQIERIRQQLINKTAA